MSGENNIMRSLIICTSHHTLSDQIENGLGVACSTCVGEETCIQGFGGET